MYSVFQHRSGRPSSRAYRRWLLVRERATWGGVLGSAAVRRCIAASEPRWSLSCTPRLTCLVRSSRDLAATHGLSPRQCLVPSGAPGPSPPTRRRRRPPSRARHGRCRCCCRRPSRGTTPSSRTRPRPRLNAVSFLQREPVGRARPDEVGLIAVCRGVAQRARVPCDGRTPTSTAAESSWS